MLKISPIASIARADCAVTLRVEGRIVGPWVAELQHSCEEVLKTGGQTLKLHLAEVEFMDAQGVALLSSLRARGVILLECPPFATEQLKATVRPGV